MRRFAYLLRNLEQTDRSSEKIQLIADYLREAPARDAAWAVSLLSGRTLRRLASSRDLLSWAAELAQLPDWIVQESYQAVGDLGETVALLLPEPAAGDTRSLSEQIFAIEAVREADRETQRQFVATAWNTLRSSERFVLNKLLAGGFHAGVSSGVIVKAVAQAFQIDASHAAHRLAGGWDPRAVTLAELLSAEGGAYSLSQPYPFFLAHQLDTALEDLGAPGEWQVEWKWDGIRSQIIVRGGELFIWSRGEELVTEKFPEFHSLPDFLPDGTVLDAELVCVRGGSLLPFHVLQQRIGRKQSSKKVLSESPAGLRVYDLLEYEGNDIREETLASRRDRLEILIAAIPQELNCALSPAWVPSSWEEVARARLKARETKAEGLMLKRLSSTYQQGRRRGDWWKWKVEPFAVDAVLVYAQRGHGGRASLYTDYTFAVWKGDELVPFAKAYSGLTDRESKEVDAFVRANTVEKFGPVRTVKPVLVFEIGFEDLQASKRHKSGVMVRAPRILRRRLDKSPEEAGDIETLHSLLNTLPH